MKKTSFVLMAGAISVAFLGCSKGRPMPSAEDKAKLQEVQASAARAQGAIPAKGAVSPNDALVHASVTAALTGDPREVIKALTLAGTTTVAGTSTSDAARVKMQSQLQESVDSGDCKVTNEGLDGATSGAVDPNSGVSGSLSVSGDKCPVSFDLSLATNKTSGVETSMSMSVKYSVTDEAYRKLNDVDSFSMTASFGFTISDSMSNEGSSATMSVLIDEKIHSAKYGNVTETGRGNGTANRDGGKFDMTVTDAFPTFSVERGIGFTTDSSNHTDYRYTVNGNDVTKEEFDSYGQVSTPTSAN